MDVLTIEDYTAIIDALKRAEVVTEENHMLHWSDKAGHKLEIVGNRKIDGSLIYRCSVCHKSGVYLDSPCSKPRRRILVTILFLAVCSLSVSVFAQPSDYDRELNRRNGRSSGGLSGGGFGQYNGFDPVKAAADDAKVVNDLKATVEKQKKIIQAQAEMIQRLNARLKAATNNVPTNSVSVPNVSTNKAK